MPIIQHAEDHALTEGAEMHEGAVSTRLGLAGVRTVQLHHRGRRACGARVDKSERPDQRVIRDRHRRGTGHHQLHRLTASLRSG